MANPPGMQVGFSWVRVGVPMALPMQYPLPVLWNPYPPWWVCLIIVVHRWGEFIWTPQISSSAYIILTEPATVLPACVALPCSPSCWPPGTKSRTGAGIQAVHLPDILLPMPPLMPLGSLLQLSPLPTICSVPQATPLPSVLDILPMPMVGLGNKGNVSAESAGGVVSGDEEQTC